MEIYDFQANHHAENQLIEPYITQSDYRSEPSDVTVSINRLICVLVPSAKSLSFEVRVVSGKGFSR